MADNYLENKMEEHRSRHLRPMVKTPSGRKAGYALLPFDVRTAVVDAATVTEAAEAIIGELRGTGCHVALLSEDNAAIKAAQRLSCLYIPTSKGIKTAENILGRIELHIKVDDTRVIVEIGGKKSTIHRNANAAETYFARRAAHLCIYLTLPYSIGRIWGDFTV